MSSVPVLHSARNLARLQAEYDYRVEAMESRIGQLEKENGQVHFMNNQLAAQIRKLERDNRNKEEALKRVKMCSACFCLNSRRSIEVRAQPNEQLVTKGLSQPTQYFELLSNPPSSTKSSSLSGEGSHLSNLLLQKDRIIIDLKDEVCLLKSENAELKENRHRIEQVERDSRVDNDIAFDEIQDKLCLIEQDLRKMKMEKKHLLEQLNSKETNLLRCEKLLSNCQFDKSKLNEELKQCKLSEFQSRKDDQKLASERMDSHRERSGSIHRSKSEDHLTQSSSTPDYRKNTRNAYCPVCRKYDSAKSKLSQPRSLHVNTRSKRLVQRGKPAAFNKDNTAFTGSTPTIRQLSDLNRQLKSINEQLLMKEDILQSEVVDLKSRQEESELELRRLRQSMIGKGQPIPAKKSPLQSHLSQSNLRLEQENSALKTRLETGASRAAANEALLSAQKTKLEQDCEDMQRKFDRMRVSSNSIKAENQELQLQLDQAKHRSERDSKDFEKRKSGVSQIKCLLDEIVDLKDQLSACEAGRMLAVQSHEDAKARLSQAEKEKSNLGVELSIAKSDQQVLCGSAESRFISSAGMQAVISAKDEELSRLKQSLNELDNEYSRFRVSLASQEENLTRLQQDLSLTNALKLEAENKCSRLEASINAFNDRCSHMSSDNETLRRQLSQALDEQDSLRRAVQRYISEIQTYEALLGDKERERDALLENLRETSVDRIACMESKRNEKDKSMDVQVKDVEIDGLRKEISLIRQEKFQLDEARARLEQQLLNSDLTIGQNKQSTQAAQLQMDLLKNQIEELRGSLSKAENQNQNYRESTVTLQIQHEQLERRLEDKTAELHLTQTKLESEQENFSQVEHDLQICRQLQADMATQLQQKDELIIELRSTLDDYKTQLDLQGEDLKRIRKEMEEAVIEAAKFKRELSHEKYENSRLQSRLHNETSTNQ